ncbi:MAG: carboxypeptidase-like regulatory domain-containing protein, partial [Bacteroidetes bacterium]|nr:carboxypeptidase-like regulatory domain-containing protein [Bacteroidota bacterium]
MKTSKMMLFTILVLFCTTIGMAQVTTSSVIGLVTDNNSEPISGANIVAVHTPSGTTYGAITNFDGRFNLLNMRIGGPYTVTISYVGYGTQTYDNVNLTLGQAENVNVVLVEDAEQLEAVVITGTTGNTIFGSDRTGAETNIGRRELTRLPSITRSASDYIRLEPTASGGSFGGRNDQFNNFSLDGAIFNNTFGLDAATAGGQTDAQPVSIDAIDQIQISLAPFDVTQAGFTGASINAVTKSGTNSFHGTVYGFLRNEDLTGSKVKGDDIFVPKLSQTQFGASIGGPIIKNKLFFFANFEVDDREDLGQNWLPNRGTGLINESRVTEQDLLMVQSALRSVGYDPGAYEGFTHETSSTIGIFKLDWILNTNNKFAIIY